MNRLIIALAVALAACGNTGTQAIQATASTPVASGTKAAGAPAPVEELPLPDVPSSLQTPQERASYILTHFWDGMVWTDTIRSLNSDFMEQNMVNFINLFQYTDTLAIRKSVSAMMVGAESEPAAYAKAMDVAEKYLYDPNSPMLDEEYYRVFLEEAITSPALSDAEKTRYRFHEAETAKNRRGSKGADLDYIDTSGHHGTLHRFGAKGAMKLVIFYDPDCDNCAEIITWLSNDRRVSALVNDKRLSIIGIYPDGDMDEWEKARTKLPAEWTNGYSPDGSLLDHETYSLRATPTIYLLNPDNIVIGKDLTAPQLDFWLSDISDHN